MPNAEICTWCGAPLTSEDGFRLTEQAGARRAAFCRLEHVVPWVINGAHWEPAATTDTPPASDTDTLATCALCDKPLDDARLLLVRHRGEHRIADAFCSAEHLRQWAQAGGRWR